MGDRGVEILVCLQLPGVVQLVDGPHRGAFGQHFFEDAAVAMGDAGAAVGFAVGDDDVGVEVVVLLAAARSSWMAPTQRKPLPRR